MKANDFIRQLQKGLKWLCVLSFAPLCADMVDLELQAADFVLGTVRIVIPEYPDAFNPSIVRWHGNLLLSFRNIPNPRVPFTSQIGLVWLNEDFTLASTPQILDTQAEDPFLTSLIPSRSEDGRLILIDDRLYLVYSDNKNFSISKGGFRVYLGEITLEGGHFSLQHIQCLSQFEGESQQRREKNWTPFDYRGEMLLAYSLQPHRILQPLMGSERCTSFSCIDSALSWEWGELRGGTPALIDGDHYLAFFHSSVEMPSLHSHGKKAFHYFMGAYTFASEPPFEITGISPRPIVGKQFYKGCEYKPYWSAVCVVFPCGFIFDDRYIWIAYGRQDHEMWIAKFDKQGLYDSLAPVTSKFSLSQEAE
jgi:predicted GH43/DUF377 family glycosyl hydrolase